MREFVDDVIGNDGYRGRLGHGRIMPVDSAPSGTALPPPLRTRPATRSFRWKQGSRLFGPSIRARPTAVRSANLQTCSLAHRS